MRQNPPPSQLSQTIVSDMLKQLILRPSQKFYIPLKLVYKNCQQDSYDLQSSIIDICSTKANDKPCSMPENAEIKPQHSIFKVHKTYKLGASKKYQTLQQSVQNATSANRKIFKKIGIKKKERKQGGHSPILLQLDKWNNKNQEIIRNSILFGGTANSFTWNKAAIRELFKLRSQNGDESDQKIERVLRTNKLLMQTEKQKSQPQNQNISATLQKKRESKSNKAILPNNIIKSISTYFDGSAVNLQTSQIVRDKKLVDLSFEIVDGHKKKMSRCKNFSLQERKSSNVQQENMRYMQAEENKEYYESKFSRNFSLKNQKQNLKTFSQTLLEQKQKGKSLSYAQRLRDVPKKISFRTLQHLKNYQSTQSPSQTQETKPKFVKSLRKKTIAANKQNSFFHNVFRKQRVTFKEKLAEQSIPKMRQTAKESVSIGSNKAFNILLRRFEESQEQN